MFWRPKTGLWTPRSSCKILNLTQLVGFGAVAEAGVGNDSFTKLLLHMNGADASTTFTDASLAAHGNATVAGNAQVDTAQSVFGGASLLLDGAGDGLSYASHADWNLGPTGGASPFTIDFWVRFASITDFCLVGAGNLGGTGWNCYLSSSAGIPLTMYDGSNRYCNWNPSTNTWYHVAIVRNGSTMTGYIGGTSIGTFADFDMNNDSLPMVIGASSGGTFSLNGWIDELRISKGIARWTANFTPPTAAYS